MDGAGVRAALDEADLLRRGAGAIAGAGDTKAQPMRAHLVRDRHIVFLALQHAGGGVIPQPFRNGGDAGVAQLVGDGQLGAGIVHALALVILVQLLGALRGPVGRPACSLLI
jgi:hypothetical protein